MVYMVNSGTKISKPAHIRMHFEEIMETVVLCKYTSLLRI